MDGAGDSKSTTRRLSDTPAGTNVRATEQEQPEQQAQQQGAGGRKGMLQSAQETVSRALGGQSRGGWAVF